jgi:regulator of ribonuclease activity A
MKPTCDLCDDHGEAALVIAPGLRLFGGRRHFWGPAVTIRCFEDNTRLGEVVRTPGHGRMLVVDAAGSLRRAVMGDMVAARAMENGWAGAVIWGAVRDSAQIGAMDWGVAALGVTPRRPAKHDEGQVGLPVIVGGVSVHPGDMVVADADGVIVLPQGLARNPG